MKRILHYLRPYGRRVAWELLLKTAGTFGELSLPFLFACLIDTAVPARDLRLAGIYGGLMLAVSLVSGLIHVTTNRMSASISAQVGKDLRSREFSVLFSFSGRKAEMMPESELIDRMTTDTYVMTDSLALLQRGGVRVPLVLGGSIFMMLWLDSVLALVLAAGVILAVRLANPRVQQGICLYERAYSGLDQMVRILREDQEGIRTIKASLGESREEERFASAVFDTYDRNREADLQMAQVKPLVQGTIYVCMILALFLGAWRIQTGKLEPGSLIAFMTYVTMSQGALTNLMRLMMCYSKMTAASGRIEELLHAAPKKLRAIPERETSEGQVWPYREPVPEISFMQVSASYPGGPPVLQDITFSISRGEVFGIVGGTGSGKSTLAELLLGFLPVARGKIFWRNQEIGQLAPEEWRKLFAVSFQREFIQKDSIRENIRFYRGWLREEELCRAAEQAQALSFISERPGGMDALAEQDGRNFSGGQRQRLMLARAFASRAPVLVLDDSFSALDYGTEAKILETLRDRREQTVLIISQRLSSVRIADRILVLEEGRIAGLGTPEELFHTCQAYREICASQTGGFYEENC